MREWQVATFPLGIKLYELANTPRAGRRRTIKEVQDWRRGRRRTNPRTEDTVGSLSLSPSPNGV